MAHTKPAEKHLSGNARQRRKLLRSLHKGQIHVVHQRGCMIWDAGRSTDETVRYFRVKSQTEPEAGVMIAGFAEATAAFRAATEEARKPRPKFLVRRVDIHYKPNRPVKIWKKLPTADKPSSANELHIVWRILSGNRREPQPETNLVSNVAQNGSDT